MADNDDQPHPDDGHGDLINFIHGDRHHGCAATTTLPPELEAITPATLVEERTIPDLDSFLALTKAVYQTLEARQIEGAQVIRTQFLTYTEDQLAPIKESTELLADVKPTVVGLFKVFSLIKRGVPNTRTVHIHQRITQECCDDDNINDLLIAGYRRPAENENAANFVSTAFCRFVATVLDAVTHLHHKSRLLLEYVHHVDQCEQLLESLKAAVREMLFNLRSRSETNRLAQQTIEERCRVVTLLTQYVAASDGQRMRNCRLFIDPFTTTTVMSTMLTIRTWITQRSWYNNYNNIAQPFNTAANTEVAAINARLETLVPKIQQYVPSRYDIAVDTARNLKPSVEEVIRQFDLFQGASDKSLGMSKAQLRTLDGLRNTLLQLQGDGLAINQATVGATVAELDNMYSEYSDHVAEAEKAARLEEARAKVEAQEITKATASIKIKLMDFDDENKYLDFAEQIEKYVSIQSSEMIKIQMIRPHLRIGNDFKNTAGMSYQELLEYLESNYSKPTLIPQLVDKLVALPNAGESLKRSLDNLNSFFSTRIKLKKHDSEYRIDRNTREKLVSKLLVREHLVQYIMRKQTKESEIRANIASGGELPDNDNMSMVSERYSEEQETSLREWFFTEMSYWQKIVRDLSKITPSSQSGPSKPGGGKPFQRYRTPARLAGGDNHTICPICSTTHTDQTGAVLQSLSRCNRFRSLDLRQRHEVVKKHGYCVKCLRRKSSEGHGQGTCTWAEQRNITCPNHSPPSRNHHQLMCFSADTYSNKPQGGNNGGGGGGGGGKGSKNNGKGAKGRGRPGGQSHLVNHPPPLSSTGQQSAGRPQGKTNSNAPAATPSAGKMPAVPQPMANTVANSATVPQTFQMFVPSHQPHIYKKTTNFFNDFDSKKDRGLAACCSYMTTIVPGGGQVTVIAVLDTGSGIGFVKNSFTNKYHIPSCGYYDAEIMTLSGVMRGGPLYPVHVLDVFGQTHVIELVGIDSIGIKEPINDDDFTDICENFKVPQNAVQNSGGVISILLGFNTSNFLADKLQGKFCVKYPGLYLMSSPLAEQMFISGAFGVLDQQDKVRTFTFATVGSTTEEPEQDCHSCSSISRMFRFMSNRLVDRVRCCLSSIFNCWSPNSPSEVTETPEDSNLTNGRTVARSATVTNEIAQCMSSLCCMHTKLKERNGCSSNGPIPALVSYEARASAANIEAELASPIPQLICQICQMTVSQCRSCKYLNSPLSIKEKAELLAFRDRMQIISQPDGTFRILVSYPHIEDPYVVFNKKYSNFIPARQNSLRLRIKAEKEGVLQALHDQVMKSVEDQHVVPVPDFSPELETHNFVLINYVHKVGSTSQPIRLVSNSSFPNKARVSLNSNTLKGPPLLGNGLECTFAWRWGVIGVTSDISRFYRNILTDSLTNDLRHFVWFSRPNDPKSLMVYKYVTGNFGDCSISIISELAVREIVSEYCSSPELVLMCQRERLVDDFLTSVGSVEEMLAVKKDLYETFQKFGFNIKHFAYSGMECTPEEEVVQVLGVDWNTRTDTVSVRTQFYPEGKRRGAYIGQPLSIESASKLTLNRELLARFSGNAFCYSGAFLGPVQASLRIAFSQLSQLTVDWILPCEDFDELLAENIRRMLTSLVNISGKIKPFPRAIIPPGHSPVLIVISVDSSGVGLGFCGHLISEKDNVRASNVFLGRPSVHRLTLPAGEYAALGKAVRALPVILETHKRLSDTPNMRVIFATDSLVSCANLSPSKHHKEVRLRNTTIAIYRILTELTNTHPTWSSCLTHIQGVNNPSDVLTRLSVDPVKQVNSDLWRHGNEAWLDPNWPPQDAIFLEFKHGALPKYTAPKAEQHRLADQNLSRSIPVHLTSSQNQTEVFQTTLVSSGPQICNLANDGLVPILTAALYKDLIHRFSSLNKVLAWLKTQYISFYCWRCNALHKDKGCFCHVSDFFAFSVLIRTHQHLYGSPDQVKLTQPHLNEAGVLVVTSRYDIAAGEQLQVSISPPIVNPVDVRLLYLIVMHHHTTTSATPSELHLGHSGTVTQLRKGKFAVWVPNAIRRVREVIKRCPVCSYVFNSPNTPRLGSPRWVRMVTEADCIWRFVSIDAVGPHYHRAFPGSKKVVKYHILFIFDLVTRGLNLELMESNSRESLHCALFNHACTVAITPRFVFADAGSSALPDVNSSDYKRYFSEPMEVMAYKASHQFLNGSERITGSAKKLLRTVFKQRQKLKLPTMTYTQLRALLNSVCVALNSMPVLFNANIAAPIAPIHFRAPYILKGADEVGKEGRGRTFLQMPTPDKFFELVSGMQSNLNHLHDLLGDKNQTLVRILKQNYSMTSHHFLQNQSKVTFQKDDVILVLKATGSYFGLILEAFQNYASVRLSGTTTTVHFKNMVLIYRKDADPSLQRSPTPPQDPNHSSTVPPPTSQSPTPRRSKRVKNIKLSCHTAFYSKINAHHTLIELF